MKWNSISPNLQGWSPTIRWFNVISQASSGGISSWTPLKPQHSNPNPLANQLWCIDLLTSPTPLIIPHRLSAFLESKFMLHSCKMVQKQSEVFRTFFVIFFPSLKQNFIAYRSLKVSSRPDSIFELHQLWQSGFSRVYSNCCCLRQSGISRVNSNYCCLWQSGFSRVYSNCCCSCSFEPETLKIVQSSHKMYNNNNEVSRVYDNSKCLYKKVWKFIECITYLEINQILALNNPWWVDIQTKQKQIFSKLVKFRHYITHKELVLFGFMAHRPL